MLKRCHEMIALMPSMLDACIKSSVRIVSDTTFQIQPDAKWFLQNPLNISMEIFGLELQKFDRQTSAVLKIMRNGLHAERRENKHAVQSE